MAALYVTPDEMVAICRELEQVNLDTKEVINRYNKILDELNSGWEGEEQKNFKCDVANHLESMEQLTRICDKYCAGLSDVIKCYQEAESSFANNVARWVG